MTDRLLRSGALPESLEPLLMSPAPEPSREVDARILRLGHAALRAAHAPPRMSRLESALSSALIVCYAAYAASQIVVIFRRG
jgi:hypothetical protein